MFSRINLCTNIVILPFYKGEFYNIKISLAPWSLDGDIMSITVSKGTSNQRWKVVGFSPCLLAYLIANANSTLFYLIPFSIVSKRTDFLCPIK